MCWGTWRRWVVLGVVGGGVWMAARPAVAGVIAGPSEAGAEATPEPVKAAVFRSTGTLFLGQTIWRELNAD